jgi:uncharacterized protein
MTKAAATYVIRRNILPGHTAQFDDWLRRFIAKERSAPGYLGTVVIVPEGSTNVRYIIHHFTSESAMLKWEKAPDRLAMLDEARAYSTPHFEKATGLETWFTLPGSPEAVAPPRWKMALVLLLGASIVSFLVRYFLGGYLAQVPLPVAAVITSAILVTALTWLLMPNFTRWLHPWLYPREIAAR